LTPITVLDIRVNYSPVEKLSNNVSMKAAVRNSVPQRSGSRLHVYGPPNY
jgi:hypothetical protein